MILYEQPYQAGQYVLSQNARQRADNAAWGHLPGCFGRAFQREVFLVSTQKWVCFNYLRICLSRNPAWMVLVPSCFRRLEVRLRRKENIAYLADMLREKRKLLDSGDHLEKKMPGLS